MSFWGSKQGQETSLDTARKILTHNHPAHQNFFMRKWLFEYKTIICQKISHLNTESLHYITSSNPTHSCEGSYSDLCGVVTLIHWPVVSIKPQESCNLLQVKSLPLWHLVHVVPLGTFLHFSFYALIEPNKTQHGCFSEPSISKSGGHLQNECLAISCLCRWKYLYTNTHFWDSVVHAWKRSYCMYERVECVRRYSQVSCMVECTLLWGMCPDQWVILFAQLSL